MNKGHQGKVEYSSIQYIKGWAFNFDNPKASVELDVFCDGVFHSRVSCKLFRADRQKLSSEAGHCGFVFAIPAELQDGMSRTLSIRYTATREELPGSPVVISATSEYQTVPYQCSSLLNHRVLFLSPHPDDESIAAGGALSLHVENEDEVKVVFLTDGSAGDFRQEYTKEAYIELRESEARNACGILGIEDLEFWRIPDRQLRDDQSTRTRLIGLINEYQPSLIYVPSPMEWHPDHKAASDLLWASLNEERSIQTLVAFYDIYQPLRVNTLINITEVLEKKKAACNAYQSQLLNAPHTDLAVAMNRYRSMTVCKEADYAEAFYLMRSELIAGKEPWYFLREQFAPCLPKISHKSPLVSIIVRTKNRRDLLSEALSSVALQRYPAIEAVVINDGGEDISDVLTSFRGVLSIKSFHSPDSLGRAAAANKGLSMASGKYINFLDDDDLLYPEHVSRLVSFLETTAETSAYSECEMGIYTWDVSGSRECKEMRDYESPDFHPEQLAKENFIPIMNMMFHRDLIDKLGGFDTSLEYLEDWDYWLRLSEHSMPSRLPGVSAQYRVFRQNAVDHPGYDYNHWKQVVLSKHKVHARCEANAAG